MEYILWNSICENMFHRGSFMTLKVILMASFAPISLNLLVVTINTFYVKLYTARLFHCFSSDRYYFHKSETVSRLERISFMNRFHTKDISAIYFLKLCMYNQILIFPIKRTLQNLSYDNVHIKLPLSPACISVGVQYFQSKSAIIALWRRWSFTDVAWSTPRRLSSRVNPSYLLANNIMSSIDVCSYFRQIQLRIKLILSFRRLFLSKILCYWKMKSLFTEFSLNAPNGGTHGSNSTFVLVLRVKT